MGIIKKAIKFKRYPLSSHLIKFSGVKSSPIDSRPGRLIIFKTIGFERKSQDGVTGVVGGNCQAVADAFFGCLTFTVV